jgi:hypothetical protein
MPKNKDEMTTKTKYFMYAGSFLYALSMVTRVPYFWRFILLLLLTAILTLMIDQPIKGRMKKTVTVFLFLFFVGSLTGLVLIFLKVLTMNMIAARG